MIRLDGEQHEALKGRAERTGVPIAVQVRQAVRMYLEGSSRVPDRMPEARAALERVATARAALGEGERKVGVQTVDVPRETGGQESPGPPPLAYERPAHHPRCGCPACQPPK